MLYKFLCKDDLYKEFYEYIKHLLKNANLDEKLVREKIKEMEREFSYEETTLKKFEKLRDSINMLYIHSYLTDSEKDKKFRKLFDNLKKAVKLDE